MSPRADVEIKLPPGLSATEPECLWQTLKSNANRALGLFSLYWRCLIFARYFGLSCSEEALREQITGISHTVSSAITVPVPAPCVPTAPTFITGVSSVYLEGGAPSINRSNSLREELNVAMHLPDYNSHNSLSMENCSPLTLGPYDNDHSHVPSCAGQSPQETRLHPSNDPVVTQSQPDIVLSTGGFPCQTCGKTYQTKSNLGKHQRIQHENEKLGDNVFLCRHCMSSYTKDYWKKHTYTCKKQPGDPKEPKEIKRGDELDCHYCGQVSEWGPKYSRHLKDCAKRKTLEQKWEDGRSQKRRRSSDV